MNDREHMRKVTGQTGPAGKIITHPPSREYSEGWERIFGKRDTVCPRCEGEGKNPFGCWCCDELECPDCKGAGVIAPPSSPGT